MVKIDKSKSRPDRIIYFDILNIVACLMVVFIHANGIVHDYSVYGVNFHSAWSQALVVEVLAYVAVPIFLMLTGATLMEYRKRYDTKTFFKKRLLRVALPFVLWMVIVFCYGLVKGDYNLAEIGPRSLIDIFLFSKMMPVYWFFPIIIAIYFAMPILSLLATPKNRKWLWYIAIAGMITFSVIPLLFNIVGMEWNGGYNFPLTGGGWLVYPILGYLLSTMQIPKRWRWILYVAGVFCLVSRYLVVYFLSAATGELDKTVSSYLYINTIIPAAALFVLAKQIPWQKIIKGKAVKTIAAVSGCSLGIYLIHILVMNELVQFLGPSERLLWRTIGALLVYLICLGIVFLIKKIPIAKNLFP
jgi:surface polysaccharide O-acyltransferase-like enzyme